MRGVKCGQASAVDGLLRHKVWLIEVEVKLRERFLFLFARQLVFQRLVLLSVRELFWHQHHLINAISVEEERGRGPI
jgi:hypothetical protein